MLSPLSPVERRGRGRPASWSLTEDEANALRGLVLTRSTEGRKRFALAVEELRDHPACTQETRERINAELAAAHREGRRANWPLSLRRLGNPTDAEAAHFRGRKHLTNKAPAIKRGGFWVDENGREQELRPYDIWESDDQSVNEPFRWRDPVSGLWMAGRQALLTIDVGSAGWMGATCIGRPRDAYRQEDIADHFRDLCELHGMPRVWRLERGSWAASFVQGIEVEGLASRWGALDEIIRIVHTEHARGKGLIEERFDLLQTFMAHTEGGITLGRGPSEFEGAQRLMNRALYDRRRAEADLPTDQSAVQRLWTVQEAAEGLRRAMEKMNSRGVERHWAPAPIVPREALLGAEGRAIPAAERWRFHPVKATGVVRSGHVEVKAPNYANAFRFAVNGVDAGIYLPDNFPIFVAFHPGRPEEGAAIGNRDRSVRNRRSWHIGQIILPAAPHVPLHPQVDLTSTSGAAGPGLRASFGAQVRAEFRGIREQMAAYKVHRKAVIEAESVAASAGRSEIRDGAGRRTEVSRGAAPAPQPKPASIDLGVFRSRSLLVDEETAPAELPAAPLQELRSRSLTGIEPPASEPATGLNRFRGRSLLTADERSF